MRRLIIASLVIVLTLVTQIGGLVLLLSFFVKTAFPNRYRYHKLTSPVLFTILHLAFTFAVVPPLASLFGREPLPVTDKSNLIPASFTSYLLNRHYTTPALKRELINFSNAFHEKYPDSKVMYLDANFPFFNGFPLLPHLSHNDGKKADLALFYRNGNSPLINRTPTLTGYGYFISPKNGDPDQNEYCKASGFWQYDFTGNLVFRDKNKFQLDESRTGHLLKLISGSQTIRKVFLEPHLKQRLGLQQVEKIRFQGCHSVRHDDHIHIQL